jgi:hypothetical protein
MPKTSSAENAICAEADATDLDRAAQPCRQPDRLLHRAEEPGRDRRRHEDDADGEQDLVEFAGPVEPAKQRTLNDDAEDGRRYKGSRQSDHEGKAELAHDDDGHVAAQHAEGTVRQVDEIHHAQRHRQAHRQDEQKHPEGEPVEEDDDEVAHLRAGPIDRRVTGFRAADPSRQEFRE